MLRILLDFSETHIRDYVTSRQPAEGEIVKLVCTTDTDSDYWIQVTNLGDGMFKVEDLSNSKERTWPVVLDWAAALWREWKEHEASSQN